MSKMNVTGKLLKNNKIISMETAGLKKMTSTQEEYGKDTESMMSI
jgi:hypothetical protein